MQRKRLHLKKYLLIFSFSLFSIISYSQIINSVTISPNPTDCAPVDFTVAGQLNSLSYSVDSVNFTIVNGLLTINFHYNNPFIILPALGSFTENYTIGNIPPGSYNVLVNTILGGTGNPVYSNFNTSMTVTSCCPLNPTITPSGNISNSRVCIGDSIQLSGAAPGATTFSWINSNGNPVSSDSVLNTAFFVPGINTYTLEVGDGNCTQQTTISLTVDTVPTVDFGPDTTVCDDVPFVLDVGVQAPNTIYNWVGTNSASPAFVVDTTGLYKVILTAGTCVFSDSIHVTVNPSPSFISGLGSDALVCFSDTVLLDATATGNVTYLWSDASTSPTLVVDTTNTYSVTVTDANGCSVSDAVDITVSSEIVIGLADTASINVGGFLLLDATGDWGSYLWSTGEITPIIMIDSSGVYSITVTNADNCSHTDSISITFTNTEKVLVENVRIYPNPASDVVTVDVTEWLHEVNSIEIYNQLGQLVRVEHEQATNQINIQDLDSGLYIVRWKAENNETLGVARLVKE